MTGYPWPSSIEGVIGGYRSYNLYDQKITYIGITGVYLISSIPENTIHQGRPMNTYTCSYRWIIYIYMTDQDTLNISLIAVDRSNHFFIQGDITHYTIYS